MSMESAAFGLGLIFLIVGCILGWHANQASAAHGDVKTTRGRLPGFRRTRLRSGLITVTVAVVVLLVMADLLR
jgi:hypothetical protein